VPATVFPHHHKEADHGYDSVHSQTEPSESMRRRDAGPGPTRGIVNGQCGLAKVETRCNLVYVHRPNLYPVGNSISGGDRSLQFA
jgi:hypothetical protein